MPRRTYHTDDRLFIPSLQAPEVDDLSLRVRVNELEKGCSKPPEEIALLSCERDELVSAIKRWAKADRTERQELLSDAATFELRTELKQLRGLVQRLKRENLALRARQEEPPPQQLRA